MLFSWYTANINIGIETESTEFKKSTSELKQGIQSLCEVSLEIANHIRPQIIPTITHEILDDKDIIKIEVMGSESCKKVLDCLTINPELLISELSEKTGFSDSYVRKLLTELKNAGVIVREGSRKSGKWIVGRRVE